MDLARGVEQQLTLDRHVHCQFRVHHQEFLDVMIVEHKNPRPQNEHVIRVFLKCQINCDLVLQV